MRVEVEGKGVEGKGWVEGVGLVGGPAAGGVRLVVALGLRGWGESWG